MTVAQKAVSLGAIAFACPWNAPSSMLNGDHIKASSYGAYADHLNSFVAYMKDNGVDLYAVSVQNEPDDGDVSVASGAFSAKIDAQSVSTLVGNMKATGLINPDIKNRTDFPVPVKDWLEYRIYDLKGRLVTSNRIGAPGRGGSALNGGLYILRDNTSGSIRVFTQFKGVANGQDKSACRHDAAFDRVWRHFAH